MKRTILFASSNPTDTDPLRLNEEFREIVNGIKRSRNRDEFDYEYQLATRSTDLRRALLDNKPSFVHFSGHGSSVGIVLENKDGELKLVQVKALANLFKLFAENIECVVLNACYSEAQAKAIAKHINYVIGMKNSIADSSAIKFSVAFYDAIGAGESIEFAYEIAINTLEIEGSTDNPKPVLFKKPKKVKDGEPKVEKRISNNFKNLVRIHSRYKDDEYLNIESKSLQSSQIEEGWLSAQWFLELVLEGEYPIVRIRNRWRPDQYINIENGLKSSPIEIGWLSAQWVIEPTEIGIYKQIRNVWRKNLYLHNRGGNIEVGPIQIGKLNSHWQIEHV
jgi:hypothetical protein